jgi:hypothetical protein
MLIIISNYFRLTGLWDLVINTLKYTDIIYQIWVILRYNALVASHHIVLQQAELDQLRSHTDHCRKPIIHSGQNCRYSSLGDFCVNGVR